MDQGTRDAIEALLHAYKDMGSDVADIAQGQESMDAKLAGILKAMQTIAAQTTELTERLNQYLDSAAREDGKVRQRLSNLEARAER